MKKIVIAAIVLAVFILAVAAIPARQNQADFLRIHIRADSNSQPDQSVKYKVKSAVVDYLTPFIAQVRTKQQAIQAVTAHLGNIEQVCNSVLASNGFAYTSHARVCAEQFPDRSYNGYTLSAGVYDALIIELGSGSGDNWWCVVYPPLCFVGGEANGTNGIVYRSKLIEIIQNWRSSR